MSNKTFAWSYSRLNAFELCPKKYYLEQVARTVSEKKSAITDYGTECHKKFELRLIKNKPLPLDLKHHEPILAKLAALPGEGMPEQKLAINEDLQPTGYYDNDVWCRAIIDYAKLMGNKVLIVDHKFGKMRAGFDQLDLMFAMMSCYIPELVKGAGAFYWAKEKRMTKKVYVKEDTMGIWGSFIPRVNRLKKAHEETNFPPKRNFLCARYCAIKECPYNGL